MIVRLVFVNLTVPDYMSAEKGISRRYLFSSLLPPGRKTQQEEAFEELDIDGALSTLRISRRNFLAVCAVLAAYKPLLAASRLCPEYRIPFLEPTEPYREIIALDHPVLPPDLPFATFAHRAGNSREGIIKAKNAGFTHVQLSIAKPLQGLTYGNDMYGYHGMILGKNLGFDRTTATVTSNLLHIEDTFKIAKDNSIGLCIEGKDNRGGLTGRDFAKLSSLIEQTQVPTLFSSQNPQYMIMAKEIIGTKAQYLERVYRPQELEMMLDRPGGGAFYANTMIVNAYGEEIKGRKDKLYAYVNDVNTVEDARRVVASGAIAGISGDAGKMQRIFSQV